MTDAAAPAAFAVKFSSLGLWSPGSYGHASWGWGHHELRPLSDALNRKVIPFSKGSMGPDAALISLGFDGEIEPRNAAIASIEGKLYLAEPGDVVYSKIDVRHGAIGVVPPTIPCAAVTSEFPVYTIEPGVALPLYIRLLFRTGKFRRLINAKVSGASGRKRVNPGTLEETSVPLPSIERQAEIVRRWLDSQKQLVRARAAATAVTSKLDVLLKERSSSEVVSVLQGAAFAVRFRAFDKWDVASSKVRYYRQKQAGLVPMSDFIAEATENVRPMDEPMHDWPVYGVNNHSGVFFSHFQKGVDFRSSYKRIRPGWFFHNPTRASVGSLGMVPADAPSDAITSPEYQVWKARDGIDKHFVDALIRTDFFVSLIQLHRTGAVKQRLYVENLLSIEIPDIPARARAPIARARERAVEQLAVTDARHRDLESEVEAEIAGHGSGQN